MRTAVDRVGRGKLRVNARFSAMASHFLFEASFAIRPRGGRRTGREECSGRSPSYLAICTSVSDTQNPQRLARATVSAVMARDCAWPIAWLCRGCLGAGAPSLMPMPRPFDGFVEHAKRVSPTCLFTLNAIATACQPLMPTGL